MTSGNPDQPELTASRQTLDTVKDLLRRDLKLGSSFEITDDMPLVGSELDLDSLDFLMVVTSIEKDHGYKIPNDQIGPEIFTSVTTLANYLEPHLNT
ncbi:acyl carrier protein [Algisphaera agarilytica]|uniref:Acyl carrier protein n=1 Tax=Algisphaera agarilytica TaxID=1385975 RepID=A0A7X0H9C6_9BACT|nr:acyl carrier protein [Algisphaera agarilytica]MBB6430179.1 acyl carrier protein [Algisphaera agarilytica]